MTGSIKRNGVLIALLVLASASSAAGGPIVYVPDCPDGYHPSGHKCVLDAKAPPLTLADCQKLSPMPPSAACKPLLTQALTDAVNTANASQTSRKMYNADPAAYPSNLSSTVDQNLGSGAFTPWGMTTVSDAASSDLTYASIIRQDWVRSRAKIHASMLERIDNPFFMPHTWVSQGGTVLTGTTSNSGGSIPQVSVSPKIDELASSCQHYTWLVWEPFSLAEDRAFLCGGDAACVAEMLDVTDGLGDTNAMFSVAASSMHPPDEKFIAPQQGRRAKNPFYAASSNLLRSQDVALKNLATNHASMSCIGPWSGPQTSTTPYVSSDPAYASLAGTARKAELADIAVLLDEKHTVSYGALFPSNGPRDDHYASEFDFIRQMKKATIDAPVPIPAATRLANRHRAQHLQSLLDAYTQLTTFPCTKTSSAPQSARVATTGRALQAVGAAHATPESFVGGGNPTGGTTFVPPPALTPDQIVAAGRALQDQILEALVEEKERGVSGCFGPGHDCDWFPEDAVPRALGAFGPDREADFQECVRWTGDFTRQPDLYDPVSQKGLKTADQLTYWLTSAKAKALDALKATPGVDSPVGAARGANVDAATGRQAMGQVVAGSHYYGDPDWFGAGYRYAAFWKVSPAEFETTGAKRACGLDGQIHGELHGRADVLKKVIKICAACELKFDEVVSAAGVDPSGLPGYKQLDAQFGSECGSFGDVCAISYRLQHLVDANVDLASTKFGTSFSGDFFFAGEQVWTDPGENLTTNYHQSYPGTPEHIDAVNTTVLVAGIPVTLMVYGEVHYGIDLDAGATRTEQCGNPSIDAHAQLRPWAYADAIGSIGIGFDFAQAGVRGKVRVVDASLPLNARIWVTGSTVGSLNASMDAHLDLALLDGSLSLFAQIGFLEAEQEIFHWSGVHDPVPILWYHMDPIGLPIFNQATWDSYKSGSW